MEKKQKPAKQAPVDKKVEKKEIPEKELDKVSGGTQVQRDQVGHRRPK